LRTKKHNKKRAIISKIRPLHNREGEKGKTKKEKEGECEILRVDRDAEKENGKEKV